MNCTACTGRTLHTFIRSFIATEPVALSRPSPVWSYQPTRRFSAISRRSQAEQTLTEPPKPFATNKPQRPIGKASNLGSSSLAEAKKEKEPWQIQKEAIKKKLGGESWNPRKKLSPDTMEGIRHLHETHPEKFTTPVLAQHFKVSPEAIRRILKSKWRPKDDEYEERLKRWDKRGERIWTNLVEMGVKPPKRWRQMGVGSAKGGQVPKWKSKARNKVAVNDSFSEDIIPIVEIDGTRRVPRDNTPLSERV